MDKIIIKQMQFYGYHGLFAEETKLGQRFNVSVELFVSLKKAGKSDNMEDTVNYGLVYNVVKDIVEGEPYHLIESVAEKIAEKILKEFSEVHQCLIQVEKPNPPIDGHYKSVAVEILRRRQD